ncbi:hypothetical protein CJP72_24460 [Citrobacter sp. NCU1]|uniref:hypothetical protein n=1 Tax=Citrobacter sp. NCU1 TaxID=2026683 RepID=UPI001391E7DA|nr:hypothetical protein [Citrobacter sp. NCU1]NDO83780.1 hypothetical protein [Citrobacter sp. NCU1]
MVSVRKDEVVSLNHFYYCLLIALKIRVRRYPGETKSARKKYIERWLRSAQKRKLFSSVIFPEVLWLLDEISKGQFNPERFEYTIERIYLLSLEMMTD